MIRRAALSSSTRSVVESLEHRTLLSSGQFDATFGNGGSVVINADVSDSGAVSYAPSGKSLLVALDNRVFKLTASGALDPSFATAGQFTLPSTLAGAIRGMATQNDGRVLLAIDPVVGNDVLLVRLLENGQIDPTLGVDGGLYFDFTAIAAPDAAIDSVPQAIAVQPDGMILVGGLIAGAEDPQIAVSRLDILGVGDDSFGDTGTSTIASTDPAFDALTRMRLGVDGSIYLLEQTTTSLDLTSFAIQRLDGSGQLDGGFGGAGMVLGPTDDLHNLIPGDLQLNAAGQLLVSAQQDSAPAPAPAVTGGFILRYEADGSADATFNTTGYAAPPTNVSATGVQALAVTVDGTVIAGDVGFFRILGFSGEGAYDDSFPHVVAVVPPAGRATRVDHVVALPDGHLLAIGAVSYAANGTAQVAVARYVGDVDHAPIATISGPATVAEDQSVNFTAIAQAFGNNTVSAYHWDLDYDGTFNPTATAAAPTLPPFSWNGPSTHTVALQITDSSGTLSNISVFDVAVTNVSPAVEISMVSERALATIPTTILLSATDHPADSITTWSVDWGDGQINTLTTNPATVAHAYLSAGPHTVLVAATDNDGDVTNATFDFDVLPLPQISGHVYDDPNYNGTRDADEGPLEGVEVFLDLDDSGDLSAGDPTSTTDATGFYSFTGISVDDYTIIVNKAPGIYSTSPNPSQADLSVVDTTRMVTADFGLSSAYFIIGSVYTDINGNGAQDEGDPALPGARVYADLNTNGFFDPDEPSAISAEDGSFTITGLTATDPLFRAILPAGYRLTSNIDGTTDVVPVFGGQPVAAVAGSVFNDRNADGIRQLSDPGVAAATVYLDTNNNGILDPGETSVLTDPSGFFSFPDVAIGTYTVRLSVPAGFHLGTPTSGAYLDVSRESNQPVGGLNFSLLQNNTITGIVFSDANANGTRQSSEKPLSGVTVYLDSNNNSKLDDGEMVAYSNSTGRYTFSDLPIVQGERIRVIPPSGYRLTTTLGDALPPGQNYVRNIGLMRRITVSGAAFLDSNNNGRYDLNEHGLAKFRVYVDANKNGRFDSGELSKLTDSQGRYAFTTLNPGTYQVRVVAAKGYHITGRSLYTLTVTAGSNIRSRNFAARK